MWHLNWVKAMLAWKLRMWKVFHHEEEVPEWCGIRRQREKTYFLGMWWRRSG